MTQEIDNENEVVSIEEMIDLFYANKHLYDRLRLQEAERMK